MPRRRLKVGPHGIGLSVLEAGPADGRPVILLHGFPEFSGAWQAYFEPLAAAAGLRVVAPDQRGCGWSDKPAGVKAYGLDVLAADIAGLAAALGFKTIALVGHDWGGIVAWWIAATMPELVERLVVLNAPHVPVTARFLRHHPGQAVRSWYVGAFQVPGLPERLLARNDFAVLRRSMTQSARPGTFSPEVLGSFAAAWAQDGALTGMVNWYRALVRDPPRTPSSADLMPVPDPLGAARSLPGPSSRPGEPRALRPRGHRVVRGGRPLASPRSAAGHLRRPGPLYGGSGPGVGLRSRTGSAR